MIWPWFFVVTVLTISKHYNSQKYMPMDPSTSLGWFVSTAHWIKSSFHTPEGHVVNAASGWFAVVWPSYFSFGWINHIQTIYISQWYMPIDPSTSLGWLLSSFHWLPSSFHTLELYVKTHNVICSGLTLFFFSSCFDHIQTLHLSMIHDYGPFNKFRMICIIFSMRIIS